MTSYSFARTHKNLAQIMTDKDLASLGDAYVNFAYSLALSNKEGKPVGTKVKGSVLAEAVKKAGLRVQLPSRMNRHSLADAAEALLAYAWLKKCITLAETVEQLSSMHSAVDNLSRLLLVTVQRVKFSS